MSGKYSLRESERYNGLEGEAYSLLFGQMIRFVAKNCEDVYAVRCAEFIEKTERLSEAPALEKAFSALGEYLVDLLDERGEDFELGGFELEDGAEGALNAVVPIEMIFELINFFDDDDCPIAFSMKLCFKPVPDEIMEIAVRGGVPVYAGEYRRVSPWDDRLFNKRWNYIKGD